MLARVAERAEDIDLTTGADGREPGRGTPREAVADLDIERARIALLKQLTRLRVAQKARTRLS